MLREFRIQDFAIADDLEIEFAEGLNVITGETGSGKSVIVKALSQILGHKSSPGAVRAGRDRAVVEGVFQWRPPAFLAAELEQAGIVLDEDDTLILSREILANGRSTSRINARAVPTQLLRRVGEHIADLHGQYQHQALLRKNDHTEFLDTLGGAAHRALAEKTAVAHKEMSELIAEKRRIDSSRQARADERDLLIFRVKEIESVIGGAEEYAELEANVKRLENAETLGEAATEAYEMLSPNGSDTSAYNRIENAISHLSQFEGLDPRIEEARAALAEAAPLVDAAARAMRSLASDSEADPTRLGEAQDRLIEIRELIKKNKCADASDLVAFKNRAAERLAELDREDCSGGELEQRIEKAAADLVKFASALTESRGKVCGKIEKRMKVELEELGMKGARFKTSLAPAVDPDGLPGSAGAERAEFLFSANPGEPPRALSEIASGGELSRVMLAFKTLLNRDDTVPVLVFDEIDTGIGGVTAQAVGGRLAALGGHRQVINITHLPQVAAFADVHIAVSKEQKGGRTLIRTGIVRDDTRLRELSRMLGDAGVRNASVELARQLLSDAAEAREAAS